MGKYSIFRTWLVLPTLTTLSVVLAFMSGICSVYACSKCFEGGCLHQRGNKCLIFSPCNNGSGLSSRWVGPAQLTVATACSPSASSTCPPLLMAFILAMMSVKVSFTVFSRIQPSLSLSGSSGLTRVDMAVLTYCRPTITATYRCGGRTTCSCNFHSFGV